ncbi:hypothetical protein QFC22_005239 [Naganishia vaughanmartiniae]|uniref:Uncharacterized protein n=1 Tax=Naganishia vaughanmartiniae TaxID=1424756 RepID=A0ACC2WXF4_9TREE|nr:hypothetical protein QFC22_005239 [Naganishia vaughanmartiniae]
MPPKPTRSALSGSNNNPVRSASPVTPTPSPAPLFNVEHASSRSAETLTPAPSTPAQRPVPVPAAEVLPELFSLDCNVELKDYTRHMLKNDKNAARPSTGTPPSEHSYAPSNFTSAPNKPKLKASDLPRLGKDREDVDQWIEKVSAIYEYSGVNDSDLLQQLPLVLRGNALT